MAAKQTDLFERFDTANARMEARFKLGAAEERTLIENIAKTVIVDKLVPPKMMGFQALEGRLFIRYEGLEGQFGVHPHALSQLCEKVKPSLPAKYVRGLLGMDGRGDLLSYSLEYLFNTDDWVEKSGQSQRFLHRLVGNELRGFLSRRFNRHLASAPLLRAFLDECKAHGAKPVEGKSTHVLHTLKCMTPTVFEVFPGEYVCVGVEWGNSDFGSGRLKVCQTVWRVNPGTAAVLDISSGGRHVGALIEESDVEMSDETAQKEVAAQQSYVRDLVRGYLTEASINRLLQALRVAHTQAIPWNLLLKRIEFLHKSELELLEGNLTGKAGITILDLPPVSYNEDGTRAPNAYWASSALGAIAAKVDDTDRRMELQREAGKLLAAALGAT